MTPTDVSRDPEAALVLDDVCASRGGIEILHNVSLTVAPRGVTGLIGPNGAGKSTTILTFAGATTITAGRVVIGEEEVTTSRPDQRVRLGLAVVPERGRLFMDLSVRDNVCFGPRVRGEREFESEVERMFDLFPVLKRRWTAKARELSGGEQQMVAIARALMCRPRFLLLDEPSLGLAPKIVDQIYSVVVELASSIGVLVVEQFTDRVLALSQQAYVLNDGAVVGQGTPAELLGDSQLTTAYFGLRRDIDLPAAGARDAPGDVSSR